MENKFSELCTIFMNSTIKFLLFLVLIADIGAIVLSIIGYNKSTIPFLIIGVVAIFIGYLIFKAKISNWKRMLYILILGMILRVLWMLNAPTIPVSDYSIIYQASVNLLNGDVSIFRGTGYISRFPHLTGMVLYMALMNFLFPLKSILVMKIINLILGLIDIILIYLIINLIFKNKIYSQISAFIAAIFPPFITYTSTFCSENIAMPFYLISIYLFVHYLKYKKSKFELLLCGVILSLGNFLRTIAIVVLVAYLLYIIIYSLDSIYEKAKDITIMIVSYCLITIIISTTLQSLNIIARPLWQASEPKITSALKGSNYENHGRWNSEDAEFIDKNLDNYDELEEKSKEIILNRYTSHSIFSTIKFLVTKFTIQWVVGDLEGHVWAQADIPEEEIKFPVKVEEGSLAFQLIYTVALILSFVGLFNKKLLANIKEVNLFYLIIGGYGLTYLIIEEQGRYSYICCYIIIFLSIVGVDSVMHKFKHTSNTYIDKNNTSIRGNMLEENNEI